jgi:hypothetical protein
MRTRRECIYFEADVVVQRSGYSATITEIAPKSASPGKNKK